MKVIEAMDVRSYVVTGGGRGVGRAVVARLRSAGGHVVVIEREPPEAVDPDVTSDLVLGDAADPAVTAAAVDRACAVAPLAGWVNNAAVFRDASLRAVDPAEISAAIAANVDMAVAGCAAAVRAFLVAGTGGAIVNVSSHQARRPVPGCLPYATAKAAIEGLTRAVAVDHGGDGIRANAVALGTIAVERYERDVARRGTTWAAATAELHALGRVGRPEEAATAIVHLLSDDASFISGVVVAVDGGRAALAGEP